MKLKVHPWRLIWRFLIALAVIYIVTLAACFTLFFTVDFKTFEVTPVVWDYRQPLVMSIMLVLGVGAFIPALTSYYYVCESKYFIMKKYGKEYQFDYSNIEYIDIEKSKKKKMVIFYSSKAKMKYLLGDKEGVLLDTLIKKCPNVLAREEFYHKHPEERI